MDLVREFEDLLREVEQLLVLLLFELNRLPLLPRQHLAFLVRRFWLIITNVDRKIASSETIRVRVGHGFCSIRVIQTTNRTMCR